AETNGCSTPVLTGPSPREGLCRTGTRFAAETLKPFIKPVFRCGVTWCRRILCRKRIGKNILFTGFCNDGYRRFTGLWSFLGGLCSRFRCVFLHDEITVPDIALLRSANTAVGGACGTGTDPRGIARRARLVDTGLAVCRL